jgi:DNA-directed RNA polymerase subunit RPC12/RpoP
MSEGEEKEKTVTHRIEVNRNPEIDSLHKELAEKEAIIELAALSKIEEEKAKLKEKYSEYAEEIDGLSGLEIDKFKLKMFDKPEDKPKRPNPSGKASLTPQSNGEEFEDQRAMVDELYSIAYDRSRNTTEAQRNEAIKKINILVESMFSGKSWKQMQRQKITPEVMNYRTCPKCGKSVDISKDVDEDKEPMCRYCKYKLKKADW